MCSRTAIASAAAVALTLVASAARAQAPAPPPQPGAPVVPAPDPAAPTPAVPVSPALDAAPPVEVVAPADAVPPQADRALADPAPAVPDLGPTVAPDPAPAPAPGAGAPAKRTKKKTATKKKPNEPHRVNQGTEYRVGVYPSGYVQGRGFGVGVRAGLDQRLEPRKNQPIRLGLGYAYEPFSTRTLGFPEEDEVMRTIRRTLVQPMHILEGHVGRQTKWGKLVTTSLELTADAWWPAIRSQQRWTARLFPGVRIGKTRGFYGELTSEIYYKKFPHYYIDSVMRRIDQEGLTPTATVGYNLRRRARFAGGLAIDYTHYLDAHYNAIAADGTDVRSTQSKNYVDYIPFADILLRPARGLRIRARYAFERQKTQHYDRVMSGRDEFASLIPKFFEGYYDYRRHRGNLWISWEFRDRLRLAASAAAWVRRFDVYEARTVDNYWTGQLRLDTEVEATLELAVRVGTVHGKHMKHDFFVSLLGSHASRRSNMQRQVSLATNFDITRLYLGFEVRGRGPTPRPAPVSP